MCTGKARPDGGGGAAAGPSDAAGAPSMAGKGGISGSGMQSMETERQEGYRDTRREKERKRERERLRGRQKERTTHTGTGRAESATSLGWVECTGALTTTTDPETYDRIQIHETHRVQAHTTHTPLRPRRTLLSTAQCAPHPRHVLLHVSQRRAQVVECGPGNRRRHGHCGTDAIAGVCGQYCTWTAATGDGTGHRGQLCSTPPKPTLPPTHTHMHTRARTHTPQCSC